jgi:hypothetical protein
MLQVNTQKLKEALEYLKSFGRNPIQGMRKIPNWDWPTMIIVQVSLSIILGFIAAIAARSSLAIAGNIFLFPITTVLSTLMGAAFFYYSFIFLLNSPIAFQKVYIIVGLSYLPFLIFRIISFLGPVIDLIGFLCVCLLLVVGFIENCAISKKYIFKLIAGLVGLFLVLWIFRVYNQAKHDITIENTTSPEAIKILQEEMQKDHK